MPKKDLARNNKITEDNRLRDDINGALEAISLFKNANGKEDEEIRAKTEAYKVLALPTLDQIKVLLTVAARDMRDRNKDVGAAKSIIKLIAMEFEKAGVDKSKVPKEIAKLLNEEYKLQFTDDLLGLKERKVKEIITDSQGNKWKSWK